MRARNIKPSFFTNELLGTYDPIISLLFAGLWCIADKDGILEDRPIRIKAELFPYREGLDINGYITVLERDGFLRRYEVNGVRYIIIINFAKHQAPHHTERAKGYPKPSEQNQCITGKGVLTPLNNCESTVPERSDSLIPDSLIPDSLIQKQGAPKKPVRFNPLAELLALGVGESVAMDFLEIRKKKRAPLTATALAAIGAEADKANWTVHKAIEKCCSRGWQGFEASWVLGANANAPPTGKQANRDSYAAQAKAANEKLNLGADHDSTERDITAYSTRVA